MHSDFNDDFLKLTRNNELYLEPFIINHEHCNAEVWDTGVIYFEPKILAQTNSQAFIYSCAIHGNETAPIEICNELVTSILTGELTPVFPVLFIFGNPAAINIGKRFVEENMNKLFRGVHSDGEFDSKERVRAKKLEQYVTRFFDLHSTEHKTHYDLHTAIRDSVHEKFAVYPFTNGKPWKKQQFEILRAMGVTTFLLMKTPATTFSSYSAIEHGADSFTIELGKVRPFGENDQSKFAAAKQTLSELLLGKQFNEDDFVLDNFQMMEVFRTINKNFDDFALAFADNAPNFTDFHKGEVLATEGGQNVLAEKDGEAIIFPNANVVVGERAILTVVETDISDNLV